MCVAPLVSVIMPCYNQASFISEALDSVLAQTYTDWECIVIDDGSTDNSDSIVQKYVSRDARIKILIQKNQGVSVARNNGILNSSGKYILPLDSDDIIAPKYIEKAVAELEKSTEVKLVYCKAKMFGSKNCLWKLPDYSYERLLWSNMIFNCAMFRRIDFNKTDGFNPNMQYGLEDWDFWLSLLNPDDKVFKIEEVLFYYRIKKTSRTTSALKNIDKLLWTLFENHATDYVPYIGDVIKWHNFYEHFNFLNVVVRVLRTLKIIIFKR